MTQRIVFTAKTVTRLSFSFRYTTNGTTTPLGL